MLIYPAIDLKDGACVRLMHGKFDQVTQYDEQPAARLSAFAAEGAEWIHIVDLDGAEAGEARQHALIGELGDAHLRDDLAVLGDFTGLADDELVRAADEAGLFIIGVTVPA